MGTALSSLLVTFFVLTTVLLVYQAKTSGQTLVHEANRQAAYRIQNANATQLDMIPVENSVFENDVPGPATTTTDKIVTITWTPNLGTGRPFFPAWYKNCISCAASSATRRCF